MKTIHLFKRVQTKSCALFNYETNLNWFEKYMNMQMFVNVEIRFLNKLLKSNEALRYYTSRGFKNKEVPQPKHVALRILYF